jgi:hypothetical protein
LERDPAKRLGIATDEKDLIEHVFFRNILWDDLHARKSKAPYRPVKHTIDINEKNEGQAPLHIAAI